MTATRLAHLIFASTLVVSAAAVLSSTMRNVEGSGDLPADPLVASIPLAGGLVLMAALALVFERLAARTRKRGPVLVVDLILPAAIVALELPGLLSGGAVASGQTLSWPMVGIAALLGATCAMLVAWHGGAQRR